MKEMIDNPLLFNKRVYKDLGDGVKVMRRAAAITVVLCEKMTIADIRAKFKLLDEFGHQVPGEHQPVMTRQNMIDLADKEEDILYTESVVPACNNADNGGRSWDLENNCTWWAIECLPDGYNQGLVF